MNRKAFELSISAIVVIILSILVLIGLALFLTGGFKDLKSSTEPFLDTTQSSSIKQACELACQNQDKLTYCCKEYTVDDQKIACQDERLEISCELTCEDYDCNSQDSMTEEECKNQGGRVIISPGDASHIERCRETNGEIIGNIPFGIEGAICCK